MSTGTRQALEDALRNHFAEVTEDALLTDWFVIASGTEVEDFGTGRTNYLFLTPVTQPPHVSMGLLDYAVREGAPMGDYDDA